MYDMGITHGGTVPELCPVNIPWSRHRVSMQSPAKTAHVDMCGDVALSPGKVDPVGCVITVKVDQVLG